MLEGFEQVTVPQTVLDEITDQDTLTELSDLDHNVRQVDYAADDYPSLDPGETAAITLASEIGAILLTDDLAARETAKDADIEVHGSIGIVLFGHGRGQLETSQAKRLIRSLKRDTTLYLADPLVEYALQRLGSDYPSWG